MVFRVLDYREQPAQTHDDWICSFTIVLKLRSQWIITTFTSSYLDQTIEQFLFLKKRAQTADSRVTHCHSRTRARTLVPPTHAFIFCPLFILFMSTDSIENLDDSVVPSAPQGPVGNTKRQLDLSLPEAASTPSRKVTTPRRRCGAQTKTGSACKRVISNESLRCNSHSRIEASYILDEC